MQTHVQEQWIIALAGLMGIEPAAIHAFVIIVHTHPDSGECAGHMETATNVSSGTARTLAISYASQQTGT